MDLLLKRKMLRSEVAPFRTVATFVPHLGVIGAVLNFVVSAALCDVYFLALRCRGNPMFLLSLFFNT